MSDQLSFGGSSVKPSRFIGLHITSVPVSQLKASGVNVRIVRPNSMITMDYRTDRINLVVDRTGKVVSVNMG
jgi:hypothetical protein